MAKKIRPMGHITMDMEPLLFEMSIDHDLQHGEVLAEVYSWLKIHVPGQAEEYDEGGKPDLPKIFGFKEKEDERRSKRTKSVTSESSRVRQKRSKTKK